MSNGFSAKNLQEQESIIMKYMDLLMDRLREYGKNGTQTLDVVKVSRAAPRLLCLVCLCERSYSNVRSTVV